MEFHLVMGFCSNYSVANHMCDFSKSKSSSFCFLSLPHPDLKPHLTAYVAIHSGFYLPACLFRWMSVRSQHFKTELGVGAPHCFSSQKGSFSLAIKMNWPESFREIWQQTSVSCEIWINNATNATRGSGTMCHRQPLLHITCLLEGMLWLPFPTVNCVFWVDSILPFVATALLPSAAGVNLCSMSEFVCGQRGHPCTVSPAVNYFKSIY